MISTADQHPDAAPYVKQLQNDYADVFGTPKLCRDIDPKTRGPYPMSTIDLKPDATPKPGKPYRVQGERQDALDVIIAKYLERGWIRPSTSEWAAQAFVVPKPVEITLPLLKRWRMVIDYRWLNSQTLSDPYPLPLIDDIIAKQSENLIWTVFDFEDGFHQMHLDPRHWHLTAFVTPHGHFEFTVAVQGFKNNQANSNAL